MRFRLAQQRALAAPRGPDERRDESLRDRQGHVADRRSAGVADRDVVEREDVVATGELDRPRRRRRQLRGVWFRARVDHAVRKPLARPSKARKNGTFTTSSPNGNRLLSPLAGERRDSYRHENIQHPFRASPAARARGCRGACTHRGRSARPGREQPVDRRLADRRREHARVSARLPVGVLPTSRAPASASRTGRLAVAPASPRSRRARSTSARATRR